MTAVTGFETIEVDNLTPHIGAHIHGVDLSKDLSNEQFSEIYQAWLDWKVLVFKDQRISQDEHRPSLENLDLFTCILCNTITRVTRKSLRYALQRILLTPPATVGTPM